MKYSFQKESAMDLRSLRFLVLWPHKQMLEDCLLDTDFFETTFHFGVRNDQGEIICCCTIVKETRIIEKQSYKFRLRAMATHPDYRKQGLGKLLLQYVFDSYKEPSFWCDAREVAVPFYLSCGWEVKSEIYQIPIIGPHYLMVWK